MRLVGRPLPLRGILVLLLAVAGATCRDLGPTGPGRLAPTAAALNIAPSFSTSPGVPLAPFRKAHVQLFSMPANTLVKDTTIVFADGDTSSTVKLGVTITSLNEQFLLSLTLIDDSGQVVYQAKDSVTAIPASNTAPPPPKQVILTYSGPDTLAKSIAIGPRDTTLSLGSAVKYRAVVKRADSSAVSALVGFSVAGAGVTVDADGTVHATAKAARGSVWVFAKLATGLSDSTLVTVTQVVARMTVAPDTSRVVLGRTVQLTPTVLDAAGSTITGRLVTYASSDTTVARVTGSGLVTAARLGTAIITARTDTVSARAVINVIPVPVFTVVVSPDTATLKVGFTLRATVTTRDSAGAVLTGRSVVWTSSDTVVATVRPDSTGAGIVTARKAGLATIRATSEGRTGTLSLRSLTPSFSRLTIGARPVAQLMGDSLQLSATVLDSLGATATSAPVVWSTSDSTVAPIIAATGSLFGLKPGTVRVRATVDGASDSISLVIRKGASVVVSPATATSSSLGARIPFTVTILDSSSAPIDGAHVSWSVSDSTIAVLESRSGFSTALTTARTGSTVLTAAIPGTLRGTATLTVSAAPVATTLTISPSTARTNIGGLTSFTASVRDQYGAPFAGAVPVWSVDSTSLATISASSGVLTAKAVGTVRVKATYLTLTSNTAVVTIDAALPPAIYFPSDSGTLGALSSSDIPIALNSAQSTPVTVLLRTSDTLASWSPGSLTFPAGTIQLLARLTPRGRGTTRVYATDSLGVLKGDTSTITFSTSVSLGFRQGGYDLTSLTLISAPQSTGEVRALLTEPAVAPGLWVRLRADSVSRNLLKFGVDSLFIPVGQLSSQYTSVKVDSSLASSRSVTVTPSLGGFAGTTAGVYVQSARITASDSYAGPVGTTTTVYVYRPYEYGSLSTPLPVLLKVSNAAAMRPIAAAPGVDTVTVTIPVGSTYAQADFRVTGVDSTILVRLSSPGWLGDSTRFRSDTLRLNHYYGRYSTVTRGQDKPTSAYLACTTYCGGSGYAASDSIRVRLASTKPGVVTTVDTVLFIAPRNQRIDFVLRSPAASTTDTAIVTFTLPSGRVDTLPVIVVPPPPTNFTFRNRSVQVGTAQHLGTYSQAIETYYGTPPSAATTVRLVMRDTSIARAPDSLRVAAGAYATNFDISGTRTGSTYLVTVPPVGIAADSMRVTVLAHRLYRYSSSVSLGAGSQAYAYVGVMDSLGYTHLPTVALAIRGVSDDTSIVKVDSLVTLPSTSSSVIATVRGGRPGTTNIRFTAAGYADTIVVPVTVTGTIYLYSYYNGTNLVSVGVGQRARDAYLQLPGTRSDSLPITVTVAGTRVAAIPSFKIPPGYSTWNVTDIVGLAPGTDTLVFSGPATGPSAGYKPDTVIVRVGAPVLRAEYSPTPVPLGQNTSASFSVRDTVGAPRITTTPLTVYFRSTDTTVIKPDSLATRLGIGSTNGYMGVRSIAPGSARIVMTDSAGVYRSDSSVVIKVTAPELLAYPGEMSVGLRQTLGSYKVQFCVPSYLRDGPLLLTLTSSDPTVARPVSDTVSIPLYSTCASVDVAAGDVVSRVQIEARATGYVPTHVIIDVGRPVVNYYPGLSTLYTASTPVAGYLRLYDHRGYTRASTEAVTFNLRSSNPAVARYDTSTVTMPAGQLYVSTPALIGVAAGTAQVSASDPRTGPVRYDSSYYSGSIVTVRRPKLSLYLNDALGLGQQASVEVYSPTGMPKADTVHLTHSAVGVINVASAIVFPAGSYYTDTLVTAGVVGVDTVIASLAGHDPDTAVVRVAKGKLYLYLLSSISLGDSSYAQVLLLDPDGYSGAFSAAGDTVTLAATGGVQLVDGKGGTVTRMIIAPGGATSLPFYVKATALGSGTISLSSGNYETLSEVTTVVSGPTPSYIPKAPPLRTRAPAPAPVANIRIDRAPPPKT